MSTGRVFPLHAPFIATDAESARVISNQPGVKSALHRMDLLTTAVFTLGGWPHSSQLASVLAEMGELDPLLELGVTAELGTTLLDARGHEIVALANRMIGITTEQLTRVPLKIALGGGEGKKYAVLAALKSGLIDILVTDIHTARAALDAR